MNSTSRSACPATPSTPDRSPCPGHATQTARREFHSATSPSRGHWRNAVVLLSLLVASSAFTARLCAAPSEPILLWPQGAPGGDAGVGEEHDTTKPTDNLISGKPVIRLGNVTKPTITVYRAPQDLDTGTAVVVCPGGCYSILAMDLEGTEICEWLNSIGVTGVLLKYRVPARRDTTRRDAPLQDAQRALGLVRQRASEWGLNPNHIGILGFSAGAHLSANVSNNYEKRAYPPLDAADEQNCRPDFTLLIYPGGLTVKSDGDKLPPELTVSAHTPPTFLVQTEDDFARVECSLYYYIALKNAKVPAEMHLYATGGHGYGLRPSPHNVTTWPQRAGQWLGELGMLEHKR